ncbi:MAG: stimulus-sensing domain-containing protein [Acidiphilium sp.]
MSIVHLRRRLSPLLLRILLVNVLPIALIVVSLLYLDQYQRGLLTAEVTALREQARIYAGALAESALETNAANQQVLNPDLARPLLYRLIAPTPNALALIYGPDGQVVANSRVREGPGGAIITEKLPQAAPRGWFARLVSTVYDQFSSFLPRGRELPSGSDEALKSGWQPGVRETLRLTTKATPHHESPPFIRRAPDGRLLVTVAEPIVRAGHEMGVVLLTREAGGVDRAVFSIRVSILGLFGVAIALTILLSLYLARTIATPLLRLAQSATRLREGRVAMAEPVPPSIAARQDEIGALARALENSAQALWARMDAIERFAADVAHEIKNPLSSIRSAIETIGRMNDPARAARLLEIIAQDVRRLDRLISDISDSSRLDSEMSRVAMEPVDLAPVLAALVEIHQATRDAEAPILELDAPRVGLVVRGAEGRLVQVLRNLLGNAISFSPPGGAHIWLRGRATGNVIEIAIEDEGPGIPDAKLDRIFDRFYSERPQSEGFGSHSGLGLSISRQIIEAHQGRITAENRRASDGRIIGARFVIRLQKFTA